MRCSAITRGGERCKLDATSGSFCWSHAPENAEARKQRGRRGGKARGAGELSEVRREVRAVITDVRVRNLERSVGAVVFQGYNTLLKAIAVEIKLKEVDELAKELEDLRALVETRKEDNRWGYGTN